MDAKERLRRYLEQRRDLGESELVLDALPVEDVLRMLGARGAPPAKGATRAAPPAVETPGTAVPEADVPVAESPVADDTPPPPPVDAPQPEPRFDATASTDWRETLRRAGTMRPSTSAPQPGPPVPPAPPVPPTVGGAPAAPASASLFGDAPGALDPAVPAWLAALGVPIGLSAGARAAQEIEPVIGALPTLEAIAEMTRACTRCDLYRTAKHAVPGEGNPQADLLVVGEAPGQNEDEQGRPFVGAAGDLLNKILGAIQLSRGDVFICNVLKHRPPGNRDPLPDEVRACEPYLRRQLELVQPRVILALGRFAAQSLLGTTTAIGKLRGQVHRYHGTPLIVTYHPAALLRNESWKRPTWEDVKLARRILDAARAAAP